MNSNEETRTVLDHWREAVPDDRLAHLVKDATRALVRGLQMRLTEHDVSFGHWAFLRILWESDGLTQRELSEQAGVQEPTTFSAMKAMEALGYVERKHLPGNKKNMHVFLTRKGKALKKKLVPLAEEINDIGTKGLKPAEIRTARKVLLAIITNLAEDEAHVNNAERRMPSTRELSRRIAESAELSVRELPTMSPPQEVPQSDKPFGRGFGNSSAVVLMLLVLQLLAPESTMSLRYDRAAILDGEAWRLLTGQLVHLGWTHCLLNVGGWIVGALLFPKLFARRRFWLEVGAMAIGVGLGLLLLDPKLAHYVGLSGVIYGVLVRGSLPSAGRDWRMTTLLLLIVGRLASQVWVGPGASEEEMIGGAIIVSAHVYGAMMGALLSLGPRVLR